MYAVLADVEGRSSVGAYWHNPLVALQTVVASDPNLASKVQDQADLDSTALLTLLLEQGAISGLN